MLSINQAPMVKSTHGVLGRSVRQRIFDAVEVAIRALQNEDGGSLWRAVYYGDPDLIPNDKAPFVAIDCGSEQKISAMGGCTVYELPVFYHMRWTSKQGVDEQDRYLYYLAQMQKTVLANHNLGGLSHNVEEVSNAHTIMGIKDVYPGGTLNVLITYKTRLHNPYKAPHEAP